MPVALGPRPCEVMLAICSPALPMGVLALRLTARWSHAPLPEAMRATRSVS